LRRAQRHDGDSRRGLKVCMDEHLWSRLRKVLADRIIPELESEKEPALAHDSSTARASTALCAQVLRTQVHVLEPTPLTT
jgi:hypothetical protein